MALPVPVPVAGGLYGTPGFMAPEVRPSLLTPRPFPHRRGGGRCFARTWVCGRVVVGVCVL